MNHEVNNTELMPMANTGLPNTVEPTAIKHKNILSFQEFVAGGSSDTENLPVPAQPINGPTNPGMDLTFMDEPATQDTETAPEETAPEEPETVVDTEAQDTEADTQMPDPTV
jgi:hypothetical protein